MARDAAGRLVVYLLPGMLALALPGSVAFAGNQLADAPERAGDKQDKIICKRFVETGSLVKGYRTCQTKREWDRERENIRAARATSGGCASAESGSCLGSTTVAGVVQGRIPN